MFSIETLKKKPALLWGSVGGVVLVIGLVVFGVVKMMRGGKRGANVETQDALPVVDTYAGLPSGATGMAAAIAETSRLPALMPSRTEVLLTQLTGKQPQQSRSLGQYSAGLAGRRGSKLMAYTHSCSKPLSLWGRPPGLRGSPWTRWSPTNSALSKQTSRRCIARRCGQETR